MFTALVEQINICRILDVCICNRSVHDQGSTVRREISFCQILFRTIASASFPGIIVISIHISHFLRPFASTDVFIHLRDEFNRESLSEMNHHGRIKERLHVKFMQAQIVLNVGVLLDIPDGVFVA